MDHNETHVVCAGCGNEIDPEWCHCGSAKEGHVGDGGHTIFIPMGCTCGYCKDYDPSPYCSACGARTKERCKCGPTDPMD